MEAAASPPAARGAIPDRDLDGLRAAINGTPNLVPGLLAWLEHFVDWEVDRRSGRHYPLQGPRAAIDDAEVDGSLLTLALLSEQFRQDGREGSETVADLLTLPPRCCAPKSSDLTRCNDDLEFAALTGAITDQTGHCARCRPSSRFSRPGLDSDRVERRRRRGNVPVDTDRRSRPPRRALLRLHRHGLNPPP